MCCRPTSQVLEVDNGSSTESTAKRTYQFSSSVPSLPLSLSLSLSRWLSLSYTLAHMVSQGLAGLWEVPASFQEKGHTQGDRKTVHT